MQPVDPCPHCGGTNFVLAERPKSPGALAWCQGCFRVHEVDEAGKFQRRAGWPARSAPSH